MNRIAKHLKSKTVVIIAIVILLILALGIPRATSDGTQKYSGDEKAAAEAALYFTYNQNRGINRISQPFIMKFYVEEVSSEPIDYASNETLCNTEFFSTSNGATDRYKILISSRTFFGFQIKNDYLHICRTAH